MELTFYIDTNYSSEDVLDIITDRVTNSTIIHVEPSKELVFGRKEMKIIVFRDSYQLASEIGYICGLINSGQIK